MITVRARELFALSSILFLLIALSTPALGQQEPGAKEPEKKTESPASEPSTEELAKQTQNPVANLISVPFQNNFNFGAGVHHDKMIYILNIQPVIPVKLTEDWNLITRVIMPIINQPSLFPGMSSAAGLGDINPTFFLSPGKPGELIWGLGPTFTFPTATNALLGNQKWSAGPAGVALTMQGPWVIGALINNQWSFAGWNDKTVNAFLLQYFVNYNFSNGWYLTSSPILTANWKADKSSNVWTVPVGGGFGKLFRLGDILPLEGHPIAKLPINTQLAAYGNIVRPDFSAQWQLRFQIQFLFPK